jgi:hypothetical protein
MVTSFNITSIKLIFHRREKRILHWRDKTNKATTQKTLSEDDWTQIPPKLTTRGIWSTQNYNKS